MQAVGLALLALILAQLGPALELAEGVVNPRSSPSSGSRGSCPLNCTSCYRPQLDAEVLDVRELLPLSDWRALFDRRWLPTFLLRIGLSIAIGLGLLMFDVPGIVVMTLFGRAPLRPLLRGDTRPPPCAGASSHGPPLASDRAVLALMLVAMV